MWFQLQAFKTSSIPAGTSMWSAGKPRNCGGISGTEAGIWWLPILKRTTGLSSSRHANVSAPRTKGAHQLEAQKTSSSVKSRRQADSSASSRSLGSETSAFQPKQDQASFWRGSSVRLCLAICLLSLSVVPAIAEVIRFDSKGNQIGQAHRRNPVKRYDAEGRLIAPPKPRAAADDPGAADFGAEAMTLLEPRAASRLSMSVQS